MLIIEFIIVLIIAVIFKMLFGFFYKNLKSDFLKKILEVYMRIGNKYFYNDMAYGVYIALALFFAYVTIRFS